jgi:hypothetical protein
MISFSLSLIRETSKDRPLGYFEDVISRGNIEGDQIHLSDEAYMLLVDKYKYSEYLDMQELDDLTLGDKARSLAASMGEWAMSGFRNATPEQLEYRMKICKGCEFWDQSGFAGTGSCKQCGCSTQAKLRMSTSRCPIDKWMPVDVRQSD